MWNSAARNFYAISETIVMDKPKRDHAQRSKPNKKEEAKQKASEILNNKKTDPETGIRQYPAKPGYHGTDDEKALSPEE